MPERHHDQAAATNRYRELHPVQREALWLLLGAGLTERGKEGWLEWRLAEGYTVERIFADALAQMEGQVGLLRAAGGIHAPAVAGDLLQ